MEFLPYLSELIKVYFTAQVAPTDLSNLLERMLSTLFKFSKYAICKNLHTITYTNSNFMVCLALLFLG